MGHEELGICSEGRLPEHPFQDLHKWPEGHTAHTIEHDTCLETPDGALDNWDGIIWDALLHKK